MKRYYYEERSKHERLIAEKFFGADGGNGTFKKKAYPFVLKDGENNLFGQIRDDVVRYFEDNKIVWWGGTGGPSGHVLSSQIACLNHLYYIRGNRDAVLAMVNGVRNIFKDVLPIGCDKESGYISFEVVSDNDYLGEDGPERGANCTSIDALIVALDESGRRWLIPIEWKYTESYTDNPSDDKSVGKKGEVRLERYFKLIRNSEQLKPLERYRGTVYFYEPFYQLMRQTLWAEQVIKHKERERIMAEDYMHIHVVPQGNGDLREKKFRLSGEGMEQTWRNMIKDQSKYVVVDPSELMKPVNMIVPELTEYLRKRYWD